MPPSGAAAAVSVGAQTGWVDALARHRARGARAVLVTVVSVRGSVPRGPGTRMVVTSDAVDGTIGGGHLEHRR